MSLVITYSLGIYLSFMICPYVIYLDVLRDVSHHGIKVIVVDRVFCPQIMLKVLIESWLVIF